MVIELEAWDRTKNYDRTGLESNTYDILGVKVPSMLIPVMPGRNLAVILETAAINNRQKEMGYNAAQELLNRLGLAERCERVLSLAVNYHFITRNGSTICMQIIADLHTHTLSATHAFNTLDEMAAKAAALGYAALAITDHGPAMPDAPHMWHFANQTALPLVLHGVAMMYGAEANVMDTNGGLDFAQSRLRALDWVVASIHSPCIPGLLTEKEATRLWLAVAENPYVDCIGHSEQQNYRYDYDLVTKAFAKNHKVVELNGNSVNVRRDGIPNMKLLLAACLKNGCHIALDTDAHSTTQLQGNMPPLLAMLEEMQFPQELVVNATRQNLVNELKLHGRICAEYIGGEIL